MKRNDHNHNLASFIGQNLKKILLQLLNSNGRKTTSTELPKVHQPNSLANPLQEDMLRWWKLIMRVSAT